VSRFEKVLEGLFLFRDSSNVYVLPDGESAVLVECGSGTVLDHLGEIGVARVSDVLLTHHHRDSAGGASRLAASGARLWAPEAERDLFERMNRHWEAREHLNSYNNRQDRFGLLDSVPLHGVLRDYETRQWGGVDLEVLPTPGHTTGSVSLLGEVAGRRVAFCGDLISGPGQVHSLAATQWSYNGGEGLASSVLSLLDIQDRDPDVLLPSHGEPMHDPRTAIEPTVERLITLMRLRRHNPRLLLLRSQPYEPVTPHLLFNRTSMSNAFVLLSASGKALAIDFGYDFMFGMASGSDRASRRPWLQTIPALKREHGVTSIDVVIPTHYHDDHVAGINLLKRVEGAKVWVPDLFANILADPMRYRLPCLWYDPIEADRVLPLDESFTWEEYQFRLHPIPGHTRYAVAIEFEVDGKRVLAAGDQYGDGDGLGLNYVYENVFDPGDYRRSADLVKRVRPDIIISGHWAPLAVNDELIAELARRGEELERLHRELVPQGSEPRVTLEPYEQTIAPGTDVTFRATIENPFDHATDAVLHPVLPEGWSAVPGERALSLSAQGSDTVEFAVRASRRSGFRKRVALAVWLDGRPFGPVAEALVTVED
jgi:glyoxylase-like metal-dependent hydrolase (beta-lactamase superfamily II)